MGEGQPVWLMLVLGALGGTGVLGVIGAVYGSRMTYRLGVQGNERQAREDERTADDRMLGRMETRLVAETARADRWQNLYEREHTYAEACVHLIYKLGGEPPSRTEIP